VAAILRQPGEQRDRLTSDVFLPADPHEALARLERAFVLTCADAPEADAARADALQVDSFPPPVRFEIEQAPLLRSQA
jgi:hypothetical protein